MGASPSNSMNTVPELRMENVLLLAVMGWLHLELCRSINGY